MDSSHALNFGNGNNGSNEASNNSTLTTYQGYNVENIISVVFLSILACIILNANGVVILAFKVNKKLRTVTNMYFVSLATCDFLVGLISVPLYAYYTLNPIVSNRALYLFYISFDVVNGTASIFHLTAMSLERCFAIVAPIRHRLMSAFFHYAVLFTVWFLAIVSSLCRLLPQYKLTEGDWYNFYLLVVCFVLPIIVMATSYSILFHAATKNCPPTANRNEKIRWSSRRKTIITLLVVTCLFVIAWSPFFMYLTLARFLPQALPSSMKGQTYLWLFVKWMHYSNSCINPFVYAYRNKTFNFSFKTICYACIKCKGFKQVSSRYSCLFKFSAFDPKSRRSNFQGKK